MTNGSVTFYNVERGFGFVREDGKAAEIRVQPETLKRAGIKRLNKGQKIRFDTHTDPDSGKIAVNNIEVD